MKYRNKLTGIIYNVTNEALVPSYEENEIFEKVSDEAPVKEKTETKKTTKK